METVKKITIIHRANNIANFNIRQLLLNTRVKVVLLFIILFIIQMLSPVLFFSKTVHIKVTPFAFPFIVNDLVGQFLISAGTVVMFCNAPFETDGYQYMITRSGKKSWAIGQIIYIVKISFLYTVCLLIASIIPFIGHLQLDSRWGKIWGTLGETDAAAQFNINFNIPASLLQNYTPVKAVVISIILEWICFIWIGLFIYVGNKVTGKYVGTLGGIFFTLLDVCIKNDWLEWAYGFSPISLAQISTYSGYALKYRINSTYGICFFVLGNLFLAFVTVKINELNVLEGFKWNWKKKE